MKTHVYQKKNLYLNVHSSFIHNSWKTGVWINKQEQDTHVYNMTDLKKYMMNKIRQTQKCIHIMNSST